MSAGADHTSIHLIEHCRSKRDGLRLCVSGLRLPERFTHPRAVSQPTDLDVNSYFGQLRHLTVKQGFCLDWVYFSDDLGGKPMIYARPKDQSPFNTYPDFLRSIGERPWSERSYEHLPHAQAYLMSVQTDDTLEGFLELAVLSILGDQFHLYWHGCYHDEFIVCHLDDIQPAMNGLAEFNLTLPDVVLVEASRQELAPRITIDDTTARVRLVFFTKWGGFVEDHHEYARSFPHHLVSRHHAQLVDYDCGVRF